MAVISNDLAALIGFGCEAFLYGCYTVLFIVSAYLMRKHTGSRTGFNRPIFVISVILYFSCATHFALEFNHFYNVLTTTGVNGFANETSVLVGADILISVTDFLGELILIYRCWLLWSKNYWIILLPSLISIGGPVCTAVVLHSVLHIDPSAPIVPPSLLSVGVAGFVLPLCTNVIVTVLVAGRIWMLSPHKVYDLRGVYFPEGTGRQAIDIVIESGALYMVVQLIFVILFAMHHPAQGVVGVIAVQIYGIAPALIIIRIALGLSDAPPPPPSKPGPRAPSWCVPTTEVHVGYSTASFTDAGHRPYPARMSSKRIVEVHADSGSGSSISNIEDAI